MNSACPSLLTISHLEYFAWKKHVRPQSWVTGIKKLIEIDRGSEVIYHDILAQLWRNYGAKIHFWRNFGSKMCRIAPKCRDKSLHLTDWHASYIAIVEVHIPLLSSLCTVTRPFYLIYTPLAEERHGSCTLF